MPFDNRSHTSNDLLAALPRENLASLSTWLKPVVLKFGDIIVEAGKPIRHAYFPTDALVSLLTEDNPRAVEVGLVGHDGMVGLPLALGVNVSPVRAIVQGAGIAMRMDRARFLREFRRNTPLQHGLLRYGYALMAQVTQISACNLLHPVQERLARWLLMTHDRVRADDFRLTHEFLGLLLGVRRVGITQAAGVLLKRGLISYSRGKIRILDRKGLEAAACRCYRIVKNLYDRR
jgi:CRP-like cAMP-binding protein